MTETLLEMARSGEMCEAIGIVAEMEGVGTGVLRRRVATGRAVIMQRDGRPPLGIGEGLRTKINVNIGSSPVVADIGEELKKAQIAEECGADTITDLSMGGPTDEIRSSLLQATKTPITTVPMYQAVAAAGSPAGVHENLIIRTIRDHVREGISSIVIHAGFDLHMLEELRQANRVMGMVSKGGAFTAAWMILNGMENPFLTNFERICEILREGDAILSLGNAMRSGCILDRMDAPQRKEIEMNAELARRANELGVQVIVEGVGGHVHPALIGEYVAYCKSRTDGRPLFVAGPLPTDIGAGHDHIVSCVGGALAAGAGADYLCAITPSEHLALPNAEQVREGVVACRIAAHMGDILKYGCCEEDRIMAERRRVRDWEGQFRCAIDGERAREIHCQYRVSGCSMCGKFCALAMMDEFLK